MQFPNSPLAVLRDLVEEYRTGARPPESMHDSLLVFDGFLKEWAEGVQAVANAPGDPERDDYKENVLQCLDCFAEALECVQAGVEQEDDGLMDQGLQLAEQGHAGLVQLFSATQQAIERLEDELA